MSNPANPFLPRPFDQDDEETSAPQQSTAAILTFPQPQPTKPDPMDRVHAAFAELGVDEPKDGFNADGKFHHFAPDKTKPKSQWMSYALHLDGLPYLLVKDFHSHKMHVIPLFDVKKASEEEKAKFQEQVKADKKERDKEEAEARAKAAAEAKRIWDEAKPARPDHPYLVAKGIKPHGLRQFSGEVTKPNGERKKYTDVLVVPVKFSGQLVGLQFINASGDKWFLDGTPKKGAYCIIGEIGHADELRIGEGFATCASIYEATDTPCAVAFDSGNLLAVAKELKLALPSVSLTVCADDDWKRTNAKGEPENWGLIKATEAARAVGAKLVVPKFGEGRGDKDTDFNDMARLCGLDAVRACFAPEEEDAAEKNGATPPEDAAPVELPLGFRYADDGAIDHIVATTKEKEAIWEKLCSPIKFLASSEDADGKRPGLLLHIRNDTGRWHRLAISRADLVEEEWLGLLIDHGLRVVPGRDAAILRRLLMTVNPERRARCVPHIGWHENTFVLPDEIIGQPEDIEIAFQPRSRVNHAYRVEGRPEGWKREIAERALGNSRLVFAISTALSGPLLKMAGMEGGGFHFRGPSSTGKSTALHVAGSVWGGGGTNGFVHSWRTTDNAIEGMALNHNDGFLPLDEMAAVEAKAASHIAYMLANGQGKGRAAKTGELRTSHEWRTIFLSTGEISLQSKVSEEGRHSTAGQEVRVIDIPVDAGQGKGLFEHLHNFARPGELADALRASSKRHYGHAARAFLTELVKDIPGYAQQVDQMVKATTDQICPKGADGQVRRVAQRFALVATAGEMAISFGVVPWPQNTARRAAERCFNDWLKERGGPEQKEDRDAIERVLGYLQRQSARFQRWDEEYLINDCAGYFREASPRTFYVYPDAFKNDICGKAGLDHAHAAKVLAKAGYLEKSTDGKHTRRERLPKVGPQRVYVIRMPEEKDEEAAAA